jgi:hypothetical protein
LAAVSATSRANRANLSRRNTLQEQQSAITGHSPRDVEAILEAHYLGGRFESAEQAMTKLDARYRNGT